jgi:hypothetical protein
MRLLLAAAAVFVTAGSLAAVLRLQRDRLIPVASPVALVERAAALRHAPKAPPLPAPIVSSEAANPVVPKVADAPPAESRPPAASPSRNEPKGDTRDDMNDELVLLGDARRALAAHQGATALRLLDEDRQRFPNSAFREERAYTRIRALCELGRSAEASADAERFLKKWPRSMYAAGVRRSCAFASEYTPDSVTGSRPSRH